MSELQPIISDLTAEADEVDRMVADLPPHLWESPTPAPGWTIRDQIAHLAFIFRLAGTAASDARAFAAMVAKAGEDFNGAVNAALADYRDCTTGDLLARWRRERDAGIAALAAVPPGEVVPWLVNPLPPGVLACAGIMELFGHGQDIADTLRVRREPTGRLAHLVLFAALTWEFGYQARGLTPPEAGLRFEVTGPSGELWAYGPAGSRQKVTGPAMDFCLLVTRRRHRDDLAVTATGPDADAWLDIAQAYRGPAGAGRTPGQFADLDRPAAGVR